MLDPELIKTVMNSFNSAKDHLQNLEKDYSQMAEKCETLSHEEEVEPAPIG